MSGRDLKDTLKSRAAEAGADVVRTAASQGAQALRNLGNKSRQSLEAAPSTAQLKKYKRKANQSLNQSLTKRKRINKWQ